MSAIDDDLRRHFEDHLPEHLPVLEEAVRVGGAPQGEHAVDDGAEGAALDEPEDLEQIALPAHRGSEDLDLAEEDVAEIDLRGEADRRAARDDASAPRGGEDALGEDVAADVLDDDVRAALVGEALRLL